MSTRASNDFSSSLNPLKSQTHGPVPPAGKLRRRLFSRSLCSIAHCCFRLLLYSYVLAGFTVNECRPTNCFVTPWTQSDYRYHSPRTQVKLKSRVAPRGASRFPWLRCNYSTIARLLTSSENREWEYTLAQWEKRGSNGANPVENSAAGKRV